jgi:hypothetical protein
MAFNLKNDLPHIRRPVIRNLTYEEMSPLRKKLYDIAREIELSDELAYSEEGIERELATRRGGF